MNIVYKKGFHPFLWLLALVGWSFGYRWVADDHMWRWGFHRIASDVYDGRYDMGPAKEGKQRLVHIKSETYWFDKACRRFCLEWYVRDDRRSLGVHWGIPFLFMHYMTFYWHRECWFAKLLRGKYPNTLEYGLQINSSAFSWNWGQDSMGWAADGSTGYHFYFSWDRFREKPVRHKMVYWTVDYPFTMPAYKDRPATDHIMTIEFEDTMCSYRRPWNRNTTDFYANISFTMDHEKGILHPPPTFNGKGENNWDCGDDGIYGCSIHVPEEGVLDPNFTKENLFHTLDLVPRKVLLDYVVAKYIEMVEKNRKRYG